MNSEVDNYINNATNWQEEIKILRAILLDCGLTEELKWGVPCYTFQKSNIVLLGNFKNYCTISFVKGVLLDNSNGILVEPGENSQSVRLVRFNNIKDIIDRKAILKSFIFEAIEVEKAGLKVDLKKSKDFELVEELQNIFIENPTFKSAFEALTTGRQRAYNMYFAAAKQSKTRESRIESYTQRILDGKGINDCICGLSKKMPNCDGSHKFLNVQQ